MSENKFIISGLLINLDSDTINLSMNNQLKFFILLIFFLLICFFALIEKFLQSSDKPKNYSNYYLSGIKINSNLAKMFTILGGAAGVGRYLQGRNEITKVQVYDECINITKEAKKEVELQEDLMENLRTKSLSLLANFKESFERMEEYRVRSESLVENNSVLKEEDSEFLNNMHDYYKKAIAKEEKTATSIIEELQSIYNWQDKGNKLVSSNWSDVFNNMSNEQIGAFSNLLFCQVILASLISIIFVFFGEYLISRFKLETRYPRLAKFIQLRRKFQRYYLILNIFYIVVVVLIQIYVDIIILFT